MDDLLHAVQMGWFFRGLHIWGAHLMVVLLILHLVRTFVQGTFQRPREIVWVTGVLLFALVMKAAFTGQCLPMDEEAFNGMMVATSMAGDLPIVGEMAVGGEYVSQATLSRMFIGHILLLPIFILLFMVAHVVLVVKHGIKAQGEPTTKKPDPTMPVRTTLFLLGILALVVTMAVAAAPGVGPAADPTGETPEGVKPSWFFLPVYQALKYTPAWVEPIAMVLGFLLFLMIPWIDRGERRDSNVIFTVALSLVIWLGIWGAVS